MEQKSGLPYGHYLLLDNHVTKQAIVSGTDAGHPIFNGTYNEESQRPERHPVTKWIHLCVFFVSPQLVMDIRYRACVSGNTYSNFKIDRFFINEMKIRAHLRKSSDDSSQQFHVFENLQKVKGKLIFEIIPHSICHPVPSFPQQISLTPL